MSSTDDLVSTKELASKLKVTEPLLKKLIKDFAIETQRVDRRAHLDDKASTTVKEILALRASGKKNNEIKEMFDASQTTEKPEKAKKETTDEAKEEKPKRKLVKKVLKKKVEAKKPKKDSKEEPEAVDKPSAEKTEETSAEETSAEEASAEKTEDSEKKIEKPKARERAPNSRTRGPKKDTQKPEAKKEKAKDDNALLDISNYLQDEEKEDELKALLKVEDGDEDILSLDDEPVAVEEVKEFTQDTLSPRKIRRRQFSFKYIQGQIANDSKRVNYIRQKLSRGRISEQERMMLEDSLGHRAVLLSGWIQLLRWVKN